jgi:hypothetical protein
MLFRTEILVYNKNCIEPVPKPEVFEQPLFEQPLLRKSCIEKKVLSRQ